MRKALLLIFALALAAGPAMARGGANDPDPGIVLGGVLGNVIGAFAGGLLGSGIRDHSESLLPVGMAGGILAGSVCGSALGVHWAAGRRGNFGRALLGSLLGELAAFGVSAFLGGSRGLGILTVVPLAILPPAGAYILYSRSMDSGFSRANGGLIRLAEGKARLGVPDVHFRPIFSPGLNARPQMQFSVRLFSAEL